MKKNRFIYVLFCTVFLLSSFGFTAFCQVSEAELTLEYHLSDVQFDLYNIASINEDGDYAIDKNFEKYTASIGLLEDIAELSADELRTLATTLDSVCVKYGIEPDYSGNTDVNGIAVFDKIKTGTYLIVGQQVTSEDNVCTPSPIIISVPVEYDDGREPLYDVVIKHTKYEEIPFEQPVSIKVMKIWDSEVKKTDRPSEVSVELFCDGEIYDTVTLNTDNDWEYEWNDLSSDCLYKVIEKDIPRNYKMTVEKDGNKYIIENTFSGGDDIPATEEDDGDDDDTIISTGQLWWPVPVLAFLGAALVLSGLIRKKQEV